MPRGKAKKKPAATEADTEPVKPIILLSSKPKFKSFSFWIVGDTPLIVHAWSEKAKREMLAKQVKAVKAGKEERDPHKEFIDSLYDMGDGTYGFPITGFKKCILSAAHKDKGIPRDTVMRSLWLDAQMVRTRPALAGAICDMPLLRVYGSKPEMREDMVKIGKGLNKTASFAFRGQFTVWAAKVKGRFNASVISEEVIGYLVQEAGMACGVGEWRNERHGVFGAFHWASVEEERQWEAYIKGKGKLPIPPSYQAEAA